MRNGRDGKPHLPYQKIYVDLDNDEEEVGPYDDVGNM